MNINEDLWITSIGSPYLKPRIKAVGQIHSVGMMSHN